MTRFRQSAILVLLCGLALAPTVLAAIPIGPPIQFSPLGHHPVNSKFWVPETEGIWWFDIPSTGTAAWHWAPVSNRPASFAPRSLVADTLTPWPIHVRPDGSASRLIEIPLGCPGCPSTYAWVPLAVMGSHGASGPVVTDLERNRALMVGPLGEVSALTFSNANHWSTLPVAVPLPVPQFDAAIAVDSERDLLILAGGTSPCPFGQFPATSAWTMPLGGPYDWTALPSVPSGGSESDLVVATDNDRLLWVGGHSVFDCGGGPTEAWNTNVYGLSLTTQDPVWATVGSTPEIEPAASAYAGGRGLFILGGTHVGAGFLPQVESRAVYRAAPEPFLTFTLASPGAPVMRSGPQVAYHEASGTLLHQGGFGPYSEFGDYGTYGNQWTWLGASSGWTERGEGPSLADAAAIADLNGDFILFGGYSDSPAPVEPPVLSNATWRLSVATSTFEEIAVTPGPTARQGSTAAYDPATDRMFIYGGQDAGGLRTDLWSLDLQASAWSEAHPSGFTPAIASAALAWDGPRNRLLLAGESSPGNVVVWTANAALTSCTQLATSGPGPAHAHSVAVDPNKPWMVVLDDSLKIWKLPFDPPHQWELIGTTTRALGKGHLFFHGYDGFAFYDNPPQLFGVDARGTVGVVGAPPPPRLSLRIMGANPSRVPRVELSLPGGAGARLELFDLAGRRVWSRDVSGLGIGVHTVALGDRSLAAGVYGVRLVDAGQQRTAKMVVLP